MFRRLSIIGIEILLNLCCILVCVYHISGPSLVQESVILTDDVKQRKQKCYVSENGTLLTKQGLVYFMTH